MGEIDEVQIIQKLKENGFEKPSGLENFSVLGKGLFILKATKDIVDVNRLTTKAIHNILWEMFEIDLDREVLRQNFVREKNKVKKGHSGDKIYYSITDKGRDALKIEEGEADINIKETEGKLKELVNVTLTKKYGNNWIQNEEIMPKDIYGKAVKNLQKNGITDKNKIYTGMTFGNCCHIMRLEKEAFLPTLTYGNHGFGDWTEIDGAISTLSRIRNTQESHATIIPKRAEDKRLANIYIEKLNHLFLNPALHSTKKDGHDGI